MHLPTIAIRNRQRRSTLDLQWLRRHVDLALPLICGSPRGTHIDTWDELEEIEVTIVSDPAIAKLHQQFMEDPRPTDVITFQHGEIVVSADTATREAQERKISPERELLLYIIHGLLHLRGHDDHSEESLREMHALQDRLLHQAVGNG